MTRRRPGWQRPDPIVGPGDGPHRHDATPIGAPLDRVLARLGSPPADALGALFERWHELAGLPGGGGQEKLSDHAVPLSVDGGTLVVGADDGAWATEWRYRQGEVLRRCDEAFGEGIVTRIEVRVRPRA